ncbi:jasmonate-induced oxygenase 4 [Beta vulgaris subsp. vulgaris]|uniref:jasmonate-induced oxygenase 4 n=1 Tax=Beta vulgaris subsp. vulgaris TaxID=3555 RepID=UPI0005401B21|nr:jasmonate-induced oxygenase 4 [Beta vulgaris subsp. vulgaris]
MCMGYKDNTTTTMAELSPLTKQEVASMLVQEIAKKGDEIPDNFLHKDGIPEAIYDPDLWRNDLLIDFSLLSSSSTTELAKLRSALSQWGCFQVINHGIEVSFLEELIEVSKQFFALPLEEKLKCFEAFQGYGSDTYSFKPKTSNWNDRIFLSLSPKEKVNLQCWPQKPQNFRIMIEEYSKKLTTMNEVMSTAMAKSLNLDENCLRFGKREPASIRFNFYPRCSSPKRVLGSKPHSDLTTLTYLLPEKDVEGLEILKDDKWYKVLPIPGALFINFGDSGEVMTNRVFKTSVHRVSTNSVKDRISVAVFFSPKDDEEVGPASELISANQPQVYNKYIMSEYLRAFFESYKLGSGRPLDAFQI